MSKSLKILSLRYSPMISKSKSRSYKGGFRQLLSDYFGAKKYLERFTWNMYANRLNDKELLDEFRKNAKHLQNARGKNYLYHEIISISNNDITDKRKIEILHTLASEYLQKRASNHLVFGIIHNDTSNPHIHLLISANEIDGKKRVRLSKQEFSQIQIYLEQFKNSHFKELNQTHHYEQNTPQKKLSKKQKMIEELEQIFSNTQSKTALDNTLKNRAYEIYTRGATLGVIFENKKYRLKTLGLEELYTKTLHRLEQSAQRKEKRAEFKQEKNKSLNNQELFEKEKSQKQDLKEKYKNK